MSPDIPEYYRHLLESSSPPDPPPDPPSQQPEHPPQGAAQQHAVTPPRPEVDVNAGVYRANTFTLNVPESWQDQTVYLFAGPLEDDIQHTLSIVVDRDVPVDSLIDYVDWQLMTLETNLKGYQLLKRDPVTLHSGVPAYRVICRWAPLKERSLYQEQLYVLQEQTGYTLTATFTKKTRQTLRSKVEHMMLGFEPFR